MTIGVGPIAIQLVAQTEVALGICIYQGIYVFDSNCAPSKITSQKLLCASTLGLQLISFSQTLCSGLPVNFSGRSERPYMSIEAGLQLHGFICIHLPLGPARSRGKKHHCCIFAPFMQIHRFWFSGSLKQMLPHRPCSNLLWSIV